jgi:hypothetical protein
VRTRKDIYKTTPPALVFHFREDRSQSLTYNHLKNAMWKTLPDRIMDDSKKYKKPAYGYTKG